jgi:two-component system OmpR family response regulator
MGPALTTVGVCEDDARLRSSVGRALEGAGFRVVCVATGHEAVRTFCDEPPGVLVLDIGLPDADGRDVCTALRSRGVLAPALFLSAYDAPSGLCEGGDDYLAKPFAVAELILLVRRLVPRSRA